MFQSDADDSVLERTIRWTFRVAIIGIPLVLVLGRSAVVVAGILLISPLGLEMVRRLGETAHTPLSFCLPRFRESLRRRCFGAAVLMGLGISLFPLASLLVLHSRYPSVSDINPVEVCLRMTAAFLVGMVIALIMGTPRLVLSRLAWNILMLLSIPLFLIAVVAFSAFVQYPAAGIPACAAVCIFVWLRLGDMVRVKRGHRMIIEDALERGHDVPAEEIARQRGQVGGPETACLRVENLLHGGMERRPYLSTARYVRGSLYEAFGSLLAYWKWILLAVGVGVLVLSLIGSGIMQVIALSYLGFAAQSLRLPVTSTMLLPAGRRERCHATLAIAVTASLPMMAVAALVVALSAVFALDSPSGSSVHTAWHLADQTIGLAGILLPCLVVPTALGIQLMDQEGRGNTGLAWPLLLASIGLIAFWRILWPDVPVFLPVAAIFVLGWAFFLLTLQAAGRRWDLG